MSACVASGGCANSPFFNFFAGGASMDYLYANRVNERILSGNLPYCKLEDGSREVEESLDINKHGKQGLSVIKGSCIPLYLALQANAHSFDSLDSYIPSSINLLINTGLNPELADIKVSSVRKAILLQPFVTQLDKALWSVILNYAMLTELTEHNEAVDQLFAWILILNTVQINEHKYGKTIGLSILTDKVPVFDILWGSWDCYADSYFIELTDAEKTALGELIHERNVLREEVLKDFSSAKTVAQRTEQEWHQYLEILNDLSSWERYVVSRINEPITDIEKLKTINLYNSIYIHGIECGFYFINHQLIPLKPLLDAVEERMQFAPAFCTFSTNGDRQVRLREEALPLIKSPKTFNYLFISYHQFRMDPSRDNATRFSQLALSCLKKNLCDDECSQYTSIEEITNVFCSCVSNFVDEHCNDISELSFNKLQQDSIIMGTSSLEETVFDNINNQIWDAMGTICEELEGKDPSTFIEEIQNPSRWNKQLGFDGNAMQLLEKEASKVIARQIVVSLNIIYLFCNALKIMLDGNSKHQYLADTDAIKLYRTKILTIQKKVAATVYTDDVDLDGYRESTGIDDQLLSRQESEEDKVRNSAFMGAFVDFTEDLLNSIDSQDVEEILDTNTKFREEIMQCPICSQKKEFSAKLEETSSKICVTLAALIKSTVDNFEATRQSILSGLGSESSILPLSALDTLTTAELLYQQYASPEYADKGFDYSCISALYYQAFEDAYNQLIWLDYSKMLNELIIDGERFSRILHQHKGKDLLITNAMGYLPQKSADRKFYTNKNHTSVQPNCTYGAFGHLLKQIKVESEIPMFCDHFAGVVGFCNREVMCNNEAFISKVQEFSDAILDASQPRNEASHGGKLITMEQCKNDKQTILNELETVRENSIGLIQRLLYLLKDSKTLEPHSF